MLTEKKEKVVKQAKIKGHEGLNLSDKEREKVIKKAAKVFGRYLTALRFDWENDPHMKETPMRVTKAFVEELFAGNFKPKPKVTAFEDEDKVLSYGGMVVQTDIDIKSCCSHHFQPFIGKCHIAYIPGVDGKVIGLSKLNRIADNCARRPQVQERLTKQVLLEVDKAIPGNRGVAVTIICKHLCCSNRGIGHDSQMKTTERTGAFEANESTMNEYLFNIQSQMKL